MKIGENIIRLRKEKGLRRAALVKKLRFIYGDNAIDYRTIERIERGDIARGRLASLLQIADALDVDVSEFYKGTRFEDHKSQEELAEAFYITRSKARGGIFRYNEKATIEIISPAESGYISFYMRLEPEAKTKLEQDPEGTIKFIFVVEGKLTISSGTVERTLYKGDTAEIKSSNPHYFSNNSSKKTTALLYQNPKNF